MRLTPNTRIHDLIDAHPFLLDWLVERDPAFQKLRNPVARATLGRIATVTMAAKIAGIDPERLLADLAQAIEARTGQAPAMGEPEPVSPEQAQARREQLKSIVRGLHEGKPVGELKRQFDALLSDVGSTEIGRLENEIIAEGVPAAEVRKLCDLHVEVFTNSLSGQASPEMPPGHPVHTFMAENRVLERLAGGLSEEFAAIGSDPEKLAQRAAGLAAQLAQIAEVDKHYLRKENCVFPLLEKHGVNGPPQVMWGVDDDIRALVKTVRQAVEARDVETVAKVGPRMTQAVVDMVFKEEKILFPMCLELFDEAEWAGVRAAEAEIGYVFVTPGTQWKPAAAEAAQPAPAFSRLPLETGLLSLEQVNLVFGHLPVEISFVDENDEVRFYSGGDERLFPRSPQVIGRKVQNCHPPKSVHVVNRILDEFRRGTRDVAEFWIRFKGKLVHIRYFAVRDAARRYRGTLEVTQDVTRIRELEGERRLLDWN